MLKERSILAIEYAVIVLLWSTVIIFPLLFIDNLNQEWRTLHVMWCECTVVGFAFLVNRFLLMPRLFFAKKYAKYIISIATLFIFLSIFVIYFDGVNVLLKLVNSEYADLSAHPPGGNLPPPQRHPLGDGGMGMAPARHDIPGNFIMPAKTVIPPSIIVLLISAFVIALDMGLSIAIKWIISEKKQSEIDCERVSAQLSNLQSQVSPHFLMNTLNNIHALVDIDSQRAKQTIIELSALMDYLLYESSNKESISLQREIEFLESYINLMRLRYPKRVAISFSYDKNIPQVNVPPLLFLNFIENAFKYGIDYTKESFIKIQFDVNDSMVEMSAINSNHSMKIKSNRHGLGISNSRKRLNLLYGNRYSLSLEDKEGIYYATLKIPTKTV